MKVAHFYVKNLHDAGMHHEEVRNVVRVRHERNHIVAETVRAIDEDSQVREEVAFAADRVIEYVINYEEE